jgi:hypothetical protein
MKTSLTPAALLGLVLLFAAAWTHAMDKGRTADDRAYVSGGIGDEEIKALQAARAHYSLWLTTAADRSGAHLADVQVRIIDSKERVVLEHTMDGPWLFVDLPLGRYRIDAQFNGQSRRAVTTIHAGDHHQVVLYFDVDADVLPAGKRPQ